MHPDRIRPTRISLTMSGYIHVGSWMTALYNWAFGLEDGIIARYEDMTALHTVSHANTMLMTEYARDAKRQFEDWGIPVVREVWQSEYKEQAEEINQRVFNGVLSWDITNWRSHCRHWGIPSANFAGESPLMAQLTRIYADREDQVRYVIRGTELAAEKEAYWVLWQLAFPDTLPEERPFLWFVPEVMQPDGQKVSKSNPESVNYALRDLSHVNKARAAVDIVRHQMLPTSAAGTIENYAHGEWPEIMQALRTYVRLAAINPTPSPITEDDIKGWLGR